MPLPSLADDLRRAGVGDVRFDRAHRVLYSTDASIYQIEPLGVVIPRSVEEVIATIAVCAQQGAPVLPRGAATSLAGQTVGHAVVIDTTRHLNRIMEINAEEQWVRCQPGAVLDQVNAALRPHGLMLGPDPASGNRATVGARWQQRRRRALHPLRRAGRQPGGRGRGLHPLQAPGWPDREDRPA